MDIVGDNVESLRKGKIWDRKKKKMVTAPDSKVGKIKTESGAWIPATYKSNRYSKWLERSKTNNKDSSDDEQETPNRGYTQLKFIYKNN